jgi:cysteinyl-tRNA synthetase
MHNGFVRVDNEKMSKSLGNFFTIREVLEKLRRRDRAFLPRAGALPQRAELQRRASGRRAHSALKRLYTALDAGAAAPMADRLEQPFAARFKAAMDDDFGTPEAVAVLFDLASEVNRSKSAQVAGPAQGAGRRAWACCRRPQAFLQAGRRR